MVPSSFITSQMTPAGMSPASRARSTAASVWPVRSRTPPSFAFRGKMWPGWTRSSGPECGSIATWTVRARSAAEIPVVTPSRASTETVKAVWNGASFFAAIRSSPSSLQRSSVSARQIRPRPWVAMKLIASGVANCAARVRSPSFSRFSSSQTTTILPRRMSSIASSMVAKALCCLVLSLISLLLVKRWHAWQHPADVAGQYVALDVHPIAGLRAAERRPLERLRDQRNLHRGLVEGGNREADSLDRDRTVLDGVGEELAGELDSQAAGDALLRDGGNGPGPVDMALDDMTAQAVRRPQRQLKVHGRIRLEVAQGGQGQRLLHDVGLEGAIVGARRRQAGAVHGNRIAGLELRGDPGADPHAGAAVPGVDPHDL